MLYGYNNQHTGFEFYTIAIDAGGARHVDEVYGLISGFDTDIVGAGGRIYATNGAVLDPERLVRLGTHSTGGAVLPDPETGRVFFVRADGVEVHDMNTFQRLTTIAIDGLDFGEHAYDAFTRVVRWGDDGLAFLTANELILVRSPAIRP